MKSLFNQYEEPFGFKNTKSSLIINRQFCKVINMFLFLKFVTNFLSWKLEIYIKPMINPMSQISN